MLPSRFVTEKSFKSHCRSPMRCVSLISLYKISRNSFPLIVVPSAATSIVVKTSKASNLLSIKIMVEKNLKMRLAPSINDLPIYIH